jgi:hypothetical protein
VRVTVLLVGVVDENRDGRAPLHFGEGIADDRFPLGEGLEDLGRDDALVGDDLPVFPVEGDLEPARRRPTSA